MGPNTALQKWQNSKGVLSALIDMCIGTVLDSLLPRSMTNDETVNTARHQASSDCCILDLVFLNCTLDRAHGHLVAQTSEAGQHIPNLEYQCNTKTTLRLNPRRLILHWRSWRHLKTSHRHLGSRQPFLTQRCL